jgi:hypothetical protein
MDGGGSGVGSPFLAGADSDVVQQHRPFVDGAMMRRLRTPFEADVVAAPPLPRRRVVPGEDDDPGGERGGRHGQRGGDEG